MLKTFDNRKLENTDINISKDRKFSYIKDKLIGYIKLREKKHKQDKCGTSWLLLWEKCVKWAFDLDIENFKCSDGWISDNLWRHGIKIFNLHGDKMI